LYVRRCSAEVVDAEVGRAEQVSEAHGTRAQRIEEKRNVEQVRE